jgi:hypothetical protein
MLHHCEEDDQTYEEPVDVDFAQDEDHIESDVEIIRRVQKIYGGRKLNHTHASL